MLARGEGGLALMAVATSGRHCIPKLGFKPLWSKVSCVENWGWMGEWGRGGGGGGRGGEGEGVGGEGEGRGERGRGGRGEERGREGGMEFGFSCFEVRVWLEKLFG